MIIEVQSGEYLGEDDIVRFEDQWTRPDGMLGALWAVPRIHPR